MTADPFDTPGADDAPPPELEGIEARVVRGTLVSLAGQGASKGLRLVSNVIMSRLLFPEAFGLMTMVNFLVFGLSMISDVGILPNIIQHPRGDQPSFLNTAFTIQALRGLTLALLGAALAYPLALFYGQGELVELAPAACVAAIFTGLESTNMATLRRRIHLGRIVAIEFTSQAAAMVVMIAHAYAFRSVWALVLGSLSGSLIRCVLSHVALQGIRNRFAIEREAARAIFSFGKWIFISTIVTYLATRLDYLLLGKLLELGDVGVYYLAATLAIIPIEVAGMVVGSVLLPALSEGARKDRATLSAYFLEAQRVIASAGLFAILGMVFFSPLFFLVFYDARYHDAGWMVQIAMIATWFFHLQESHVKALLAVGDAAGLATANLTKLAVSALMALAGFRVLGLAGFLLGMGAGSLCGHAVVLVKLERHGIRALSGDIRWTSIGAVLAAAGAYGPVLLEGALPVRVEIATAAAGVVCLVPLGLFVARRLRDRLQTRSS
jgi:O-antigen/teichoic acid export membrane protein